MPNVNDRFYTTIGCLDGRVQEAVIAFGKRTFGAKYPDTITESGLVGKLSKGVVDPVLREKIRKKVVDISIGTHNSKGIVVHGHMDCSGNKVQDSTHQDDIRQTVDFIKELVNEEIPVIGVWVKQEENNWVVEEVSQTVAV